MKSFVFGLILLTSPLATAWATAVAVFDNSTYVDAGSPSSSADAVKTLLGNLGYSVSPFSGFAASDFTAAGGSANLLLFPDLKNDFQNVLDGPAKAAIANYVANGGGLIAIGNYAHELLDRIFYPTCDFVTVFCFASSGVNTVSYLDNAVAAGTLFATAPATLSSTPVQATGVNPFAFTPSGGLNLYRDQVGGSPNSTTVLEAPFGNGHYGYLAWTYANSAGPGNLGGWDTVLDSMVQTVASVPEPDTLPLACLGLVLMLGNRKYRRPKCRRLQ